MRGWVLAAAVVAMVVVAVVCEEQQSQGQDCKAQRTCGQCIQTAGCSWCVNPQSGEHCQPTNLTTAQCSETDKQDPKNEVKLVKNEELTGATHKNKKEKDPNKEVYQLKPQKVKLKLRVGEPQELNIKYRRALGYPVDLYYLMDLSKSMLDDKENLARAGSDLAQTMLKLTDNFTIGFGSFVDKVMMPFSNTTQLYKEKPCTNCADTYSFRNDMKLSPDHAAFTDMVSKAQISGNLDHPEGGFDALMQAMVCKDQIGWRDNVRHILVFSTDAKFHHAGDGRLAGVVLPNDEQCHLTKGEYTDFDKYDYPSIAQINKVAEENKINIIFAVLSDGELYSDLSKAITTSSFGMLQNGSTNVVDLIEKQYNSISSSLSLSDNSTNDITIKYYSSCTGEQPVKTTKKCDGISEDDEVTFKLEITATSCPEKGNKSIVEVKTLEASVILDIEFFCDCNCTSHSNTSCKNGGSMKCGVCECLKGFYGEECQCKSGEDSYDLNDIQDQNAMCMARDTDTRPCSGRGLCKCGTCDCSHPEVSGTYCQCDKRKCKSLGGTMCSGHGTCDCNECRCNEGYSGVHCHCEDQACKPKDSDKVCSGHGKCECGRCTCNQEGNTTYTGRYCEDCLSCGTGKCKKLKPCVQCVHFGNGPLKDNCECERSGSTAVENLDDYMYDDSRLCTFKDEDGCYLNFTYRYKEDTGKEEVHVQAERKCQEEPNIAAIVFSLIAAIVGVGVLTLILWKIFTTIHDKREYAKFLEETQRAPFNEENPLFIDPNTTTQNPVFQQQQ